MSASVVTNGCGLLLKKYERFKFCHRICIRSLACTGSWSSAGTQGSTWICPGHLILGLTLLGRYANELEHDTWPRLSRCDHMPAFKLGKLGRPFGDDGALAERDLSGLTVER